MTTQEITHGDKIFNNGSKNLTNLTHQEDFKIYIP